MDPPEDAHASDKSIERTVGNEEAEEYEASVSEGCSATNTPGSVMDAVDGALRFVSPPSITASISRPAAFNPAAAPFVPSASASPYVPASVAEATAAAQATPVSVDAGKVVDVPKRWFCQLLGPVFLKPLTAEQWREELERLAHVTVGTVDMHPTDTLSCCVSLTAVGDTLRDCHGRNMSSRSNGTWTLVAEPIVSIVFAQTAVAMSTTTATVIKHLSEAVGCSFLSARTESPDDDAASSSTDAAGTVRSSDVSIVVDVREADALYLLGWNRCLSIGSDGSVSRGDRLVVSRNA